MSEEEISDLIKFFERTCDEWRERWANKPAEEKRKVLIEKFKEERYIVLIKKWKNKELDETEKHELCQLLNQIP